MPLLASFISAGGLVIGSVIGACCSWYINKLSLTEQFKMQKQNFSYKEKDKINEIYINSNIVRLDFCTAIYQSIRYLQDSESTSDYYTIPIYKDYNRIVASLGSNYSLKELSYIYQLYAVIDNVHISLSKAEKTNNDNYIYIRSIFFSVIKKVYGNNYLKILNKDVENISFEELYNDNLMKEGYRNLLNSLDLACRNKNIKY